MSDTTKLVDKHYQDLYAGYYKDSRSTLLKRKISAMQTAECISTALSGRTIGRLLDVGAGDGNVLVELDRRGIAHELFAVEVSESGVDAIRAKNIHAVRDARRFDGYSIPYPDKHFDVAIATHVLEHVEHERLFLREIGRVSRFAYIEVPLEHGFRIQKAIEAGRKYGHINFYTKETFKSMLESTGFRVMKCEVVSPSLRYDQYLSGPVKGWIKNLIRTSALAITPNLAPLFFVYNGFAYCECV